MNRQTAGESSQRKRKNPFKPIMITSKSMKPVERSSPDKLKLQRKDLESNHQYRNRKPSISCMVYSNSMSRAEMIRRLTSQYRESLLKNLQKEDNNNRHKAVTPSVVKMEFDLEEVGCRLRDRYEELLSNLSFDDLPSANRKLTNLTAMKNYDGYYVMNRKISNSNGFMTKKKINKIPSQQKYPLLNYPPLKIKKVNPPESHNINSRISPQKMHEISAKVDQYQKCLVKKMEEKYRSSFSVIANRNQENNPTSQIQDNSEIFLKSDQNKIQDDIQTKRASLKKQYFVFGLSDSAKPLGESSSKNRFQLYKDFLWKVNFSNNLYVRLKDQIQNPYKLYIGHGNNSMLIRGIVRRRFWWQIVEKISDDVNFVWTQLKINDFLKVQKEGVNLTNIEKSIMLFRNRKVHSSTESQVREGKQQKSGIKDENKEKGKDLQKVEESVEVHRKIFNRKDCDLWEKHLDLHKKNENKMENYLPKRIKTMVRKKKLRFVEQSKKLKVHNHLECNYFLGNKKALFYSLLNYYNLIGKDPFANIPLTFHIIKGHQDQEFLKFVEKYEEFQEKKKQKESQNIWIVKPGEFTNRGKGITVCSILDDIQIRIRSKEKSRFNQPHTYIIQKYIEKPLLFHKRKFDIRHFLLVTCVNGMFKSYWYSQGYLRTTSFQYNIKNCKDVYTHLTNDAIQKNSPDYGKFEKGNKVSYSDFQKYLNSTMKSKKKDSEENEKYDFFGSTLPKMKKLAADAVRATYLMLSPQRYEHNFELFGLDYMLDENMNVYLIQVNNNPCLQISCPFLAPLLSGLIQNIFKICIDPLFPPPHQWMNSKKMPFGDNAFEENKFNLIFDEIEEGPSLKKLFENSQSMSESIGNIEEEDEEYEDEGKEWVED